MEEEVKKAVNSFCTIFPIAKVGDYSHPTDTKRLLEIAYQADIANDNVTTDAFEKELSSVNQSTEITVIQSCAKDCCEIISKAKSTIKYLDEMGYLIK